MMSVSVLLLLTWRLYKENLSVFLGYSAWVLVPYVGILITEMSPIASHIETSLQAVFILLQTLLVVWATTAMTFVTFAIVRKKQVRLAALGRRSWRLVPHVLIAVILAFLIIVGGTLLLLIPGLVFWVWYGFVQQETILHKQRGWNALASSHDLVRGRFWPVAWRLVAGPLFILLGYVFLIALLFALFGLFTETENLIATSNIYLYREPLLWQEVLGNIFDMLLLPFFGIYSTLLYLDVRAASKKNVL